MNSHLPLVAIVGRPNVGKSSFFNRIAGRRISIVKDEPGVTRDRIYADAEWCGFNFRIVDTGGLDIKSKDEMWKTMLKQAQLAVDLADVVVLVVDGKASLQQADQDVANFLKKSGKSVVLAVNKVDNINSVDFLYDYFKLGLGTPHAISCEQALGLGDLLDEIVKFFVKSQADLSQFTKIAVVGKPNVGKSSIVNRILGYDRVIVSQMAGTTRDAVDTPFEKDKKLYLLIDTAGLRRQRSIQQDTVEAYGALRAIESIRRADIVLVVADASEDFCEQTVRICGLVHQEGKPSIIVINKWDMLDKDNNTMKIYNERLQSKLAFMHYFVTLYVSAKTGQRVDKLLDRVDSVMDNANRRISTSLLNEIVGQAVAANQPYAPHGKRVKIFYATQAQSFPPKFVVFCNDSTLVHNTYKRYLENCIRKSVDFKGVPLKLYFNNSKKEE
ncbi:MAG: ribosome biogenesis GTPase Der [Clostridiales bacterium]|jgi:GTP-binding protein|nr:ribosome biogenesis GTPase Der [Clostridiales bacterium]